ncbi:putative HNHc nuclease [Vagococcus intermedius]|uniref:HNHc nuclease n=1 Tax=Vagococcus intermedius TaxID=2991418 RepID=A0AAF0CX15_9ENTE|nr:putative HNHc nuclease [Vagococcus intermedius]WEG74391.1 putative HNHc nuclease [Vagococcus intermedius]WEG76512.1 putative HNHc nuclease [Vagococcus intermedius]
MQEVRLIGRDSNGNYVLRPSTVGDNKAMELAIRKGHKYFKLETIDPESITALQRRKIYAMFKDINEYWCDPLELVKEYLKTHFCFETGRQTFSLSSCSQETAMFFIDWLVSYCFKHGLDFDMKDIHLTMDVNKVMFLCAAERRCFVSARQRTVAALEIHHVNAIGKEKRSKADHRGRYYMILEKKYHDELHFIGYTKFIAKYHCGPIKLTDDQIIKYGLMSRKQMDERDSNPHYEMKSWQLPE